jgi:arylsulfatase
MMKGTSAIAVIKHEIERTQLQTSIPLPTGKVKIEVETRKVDGFRPDPIDVVIRVNGTEVSKGQVLRAASLTFTANDSFDVGRNSYSPVSLIYFDRKPFAFNGTTRHLKVDYFD